MYLRIMRGQRRAGIVSTMPAERVAAQCEFNVGLVVLRAFEVFHLEAMLDEETILP